MKYWKTVANPMTTGLVIGVGIGVAMENLSMGVAIGLALGSGMMSTWPTASGDARDEMNGPAEDPPAKK